MASRNVVSHRLLRWGAVLPIQAVTEKAFSRLNSAVNSEMQEISVFNNNEAGLNFNVGGDSDGDSDDDSGDDNADIKNLFNFVSVSLRSL